MADENSPVAVRCAKCGARVDVPSGHHGGVDSLEGGTARCPKCGHINDTAGPSELKPSVVKDQQLLRRI